MTMDPNNEVLLKEFPDVGLSNSIERVVYLAGTLAVGGAETELINQVKALKLLGIEVWVLSLRSGEALEPVLQDMGVGIKFVGGLASRPERAVAISRAARALQPDVFHSQHFYTNLYAKIAGWFCGSSVVGSVQNDVYSEVKANGLLGTSSWRLLPWLTANSEKALSTLLELGYSPDRAFLLRNAVDIDGFDRMASQGDFPPRANGVTRIIAVGRLVAQKRVDRLLTVVKQLQVAGRRFEVFVVGEGPLRCELTSMAQEMGLDGIVQFFGQRGDVPALLKGSDIFLLTSDHEGLPNVVQEAMTAGLPIVTGAVGGVAEILCNGAEGYIVRRDDVPGYVNVLSRLVSDRDMRLRIGSAARVRAENDFSLERLGNRLIEIYSAVRHADSTREPQG